MNCGVPKRWCTLYDNNSNDNNSNNKSDSFDCRGLHVSRINREALFCLCLFERHSFISFLLTFFIKRSILMFNYKHGLGSIGSLFSFIGYRSHNCISDDKNVFYRLFDRFLLKKIEKTYVLYDLRLLPIDRFAFPFLIVFAQLRSNIYADRFGQNVTKMEKKKIENTRKHCSWSSEM